MDDAGLSELIAAARAQVRMRAVTPDRATYEQAIHALRSRGVQIEHSDVDNHAVVTGYLDNSMRGTLIELGAAVGYDRPVALRLPVGNFLG